MVTPEEITCKIESKVDLLFPEATLKLKLKNTRPICYAINGNYVDKAINRKEEVNVLKWFDNYWVYIEITFLPSTDNTSDDKYNILFSLSIFDGEHGNVNKQQLFRAEWDNYPDMEHPQPHWHFYSTDDFNAEKDFDEYIEDSEETFMDIIDTSSIRNTSFQKMHFAMNGQWDNSNGHVHKIKSSESFSDWVFGLIDHIGAQLKYIK